MSIHKSKGLEFPVVFLCNSQKKFNMQDLNESILLHQDLGLGPTFIDTKKKIKYSTLAKEAIKLQMKQETLSEEEREDFLERFQTMEFHKYLGARRQSVP